MNQISNVHSRHMGRIWESINASNQHMLTHVPNGQIAGSPLCGVVCSCHFPFVHFYFIITSCLFHSLCILYFQDYFLMQFEYTNKHDYVFWQFTANAREG